MSILRDIWRVIRGDLSYAKLDDALCEAKRFEDLSERLYRMERNLIKIESAIAAIVPGLARIIAKVDPMYGTPEDDPERVAASKRLGMETEARLKAEALARRQTGGAT